MTKGIIEDQMPKEIDFSKASRGLHHVPQEAKIYLPVAIEKSVWEYFPDKAERKGADLPEPLSAA